MAEPNPNRVAVVQMRSTPDVSANLEAMARLVTAAADRGAATVMLPEAFAFIGPEKDKRQIVEPLPVGGPILHACQQLAETHGLHLILGGFHEASDDPAKSYNTCVHLAPNGDVIARYRKIHLFDIDLADGTRLRESDATRGGDETVVTEAPFGTLGLSVCYDLRFPALYQALVDAGAVALTVPSAFTASTGKDHWHVLLRARAIECQSYVLAPAQWGHHYGKRSSYGHALIVDPWGCVIAECSDGEGVAVADLDLDVLNRARTELPSLKHRRL
jgi:predicted amidohydrolase